MRRLLGIALGAVALGAANSAFAQGTPSPYYPYNFSLRLGVVLPLEDRLSDLNSNLASIGFDYRLGRSLIPGGESYFSLDYWTKGLDGSKGSVFPIHLNQKWYTGPKSAPEKTYYFIGIGATVFDVDVTDTAISIRGGIGSQLGESTFYELAGYLSNSATNGIRSNSLQLSLGYRF